MASKRSSTTKRTPYKRSSASSKPSPRAWIIAILLVLIFAGGIGFLDSRHKNDSTTFIHQIFQHKHTSTEIAKVPDFEFYTALPSGKLTTMPSDQSSLEKKADTNTVLTKSVTNVFAPAATASGVHSAKAPTTNNTNYFLQVASFPQYADADKLKAQLLLDDFNANIERSVINGKEWYRVVVGPYNNLNTLNAAQTQLNALHFQSIKLQLK